MFTLPDNPYQALSVSQNAQIPEIRTAYRKLVLKCHPDKVTDPAQKAAKAEEFQKVQKAYELLCDENERQKYDDMVRANELEKENAERRRQRDREFTPGRTPPRTYDSDYGRSPHYTVHVKGDPGYKVRSADPPPTFSKSSTWAPPGSKSPYANTRTPPRSFEDNINSYSSYEDLPPRDSREARRARKAYDEKAARDDDRERKSRKKEQEEYERAQEKARRKDAERREAERKEAERRDKERRKDEKKRAEKARDTDRRKDGDEKRRQKAAYVEEDPEPAIYTVNPPKSEKKSKSSSRSKEVPPVQVREVREPKEHKSEREIKDDAKLAFAAQYLQTSRSKVAPGLNRAQTYHYNVRSVSPERPPPAVATPPPAAEGLARPPMQSMNQALYEEDDEPVLRSSARRRMSHDTPRTKEKTSSHKKSSSREPEYAAESSRPIPSFKKSATMPSSHVHQGTPPMESSPPKPSRSKTEYVRPSHGPIPGMTRTTTWAPGDDVRGNTRPRNMHSYSEDESEEEMHNSRSARVRVPSPDRNTFTYRVENGRAKPAVRAAYVREDSPPSRSRAKAYYTEANSGRPLEHRPAMYSHDSYSSQPAFKVKTSRAYDHSDVHFGEVPHAPSYSSREQYGYA